MYCEQCGNKLEEQAQFCDECGVKLVVENTPKPTTLQTQAILIVPDRRQQSIIGLFKAMFALRLVDAIGWTLLIIIQIWGGVDIWTIVWNIVATIIHYGLAIELFDVISSGKFNSVQVIRVIRNNAFISVIGIAFYGWQLFSDDVFILLPFIGLEIAILALGAIAYFLAKQINIETIPEKDMNIRLQQGEAVILNGRCTRALALSRVNSTQNSGHNSGHKEVFHYDGVGTLTNMRFVFMSNPGNTQEWAVDTYGEDAPFQEMTDFSILLADIADVSETKENKLSQDVKMFIIKSKAGRSHNFKFNITVKDSWTGANTWLNAFHKALKG
jgi:hypothetical protein